jgi:hypothetical protein
MNLKDRMAGAIRKKLGRQNSSEKDSGYDSVATDQKGPDAWQYNVQYVTVRADVLLKPKNPYHWHPCACLCALCVTAGETGLRPEPHAPSRIRPPGM